VGAAVVLGSWWIRRSALVAGLGGIAAIGAAAMPWPQTFTAPAVLRIVVALTAVGAVVAVSSVARRGERTTPVGD